MSECGVNCVSGTCELEGIRVADDIGHVDADSKDIVFAAFSQWFNIANPPPPPPAFERFDNEARPQSQKFGASAPLPFVKASRCMY